MSTAAHQTDRNRLISSSSRLVFLPKILLSQKPHCLRQQLNKLARSDYGTARLQFKTPVNLITHTSSSSSIEPIVALETR